MLTPTAALSQPRLKAALSPGCFSQHSSASTPQQSVIYSNDWYSLSHAEPMRKGTSSFCAATHSCSSAVRPWKTASGRVVKGLKVSLLWVSRDGDERSRDDTSATKYFLLPHTVIYKGLGNPPRCTGGNQCTGDVTKPVHAAEAMSRSLHMELRLFERPTAAICLLNAGGKERTYNPSKPEKMPSS